ncbi:type-F conjugative transfer system pilin assembly protein TrbC [Legionella qingyii]|uniref:Type-F conjugative transfer system pilin assembly protein TrbC n=1 Tax=Legionella qingyii TaxID=2184757 RepID=A0A317TYB4_9GAMM|nr:type-F conjugative transfer system pilin assembly protein TrbC [Legionella qingyii]PWY53815.1 type-F conjugative transfer system pilin assembly protein TrbC [Legionella qingyii]RUR24149.1 type-F conjugative transfer system pilin assembly protein TrbC [Legionella qingyii]
MFKKGITLIIGCCVPRMLIAATVSVFVSFSMPNNLLEETLKESARLNIPVYLNGLYHDSMQLTASKVIELSEHVPNLNLQIDPTLFERFGIYQVPALVVDNGSSFDVIYGHLPLKEGLMRMVDRGESGFSTLDARRVIGE